MDGPLIMALIFRSSEEQQWLPDFHKGAKPVGLIWWGQYALKTWPAVSLWKLPSYKHIHKCGLYLTKLRLLLIMKFHFGLPKTFVTGPFCHNGKISEWSNLDPTSKNTIVSSHSCIAFFFLPCLSGQSKGELDHFSQKSAPFCFSLWGWVALPCPVTWHAGLHTKWLDSPLLFSLWGWHVSAFCSCDIHTT